MAKKLKRAPKASPPSDQAMGERFAKQFAPPELYDPAKRADWRLEEGPDGRGPYVVELNLQHSAGLAGAAAALKTLHAAIASDAPAPVRISRTYYRVHLNVREWQALLRADEEIASAESVGESTDGMHFRAIYKLWPDFPIESQVYKSAATIKANAARLSFEAEGDGIVWAVIDSGVDASHPHFATHDTLNAADVRDLHRSFVEAPRTSAGGIELAPSALPDPDEEDLPPEERKARLAQHHAHALSDRFGHGTHVAGIIAGQAPEGSQVQTFERMDRMTQEGELERGTACAPQSRDPKRLRGIAPRCRLVSLRVLDDKGAGRSSDVIRALEYVREKLNDNPKILRVHGVNLSVGYEFDAEMFACGQSPICVEVNRLVQAGVVVVAAAGNTGHGTVAATARPAKVGLSNTINDPGNAEHAITVGATHRDAPHTYGVSYFSSKGPTGDGRLKPDLVAPGERITSCGTGDRLAKAIAGAELTAPAAGSATAYYMEDSGTSMAAPHVSGAIAAFLSIRREFAGKPIEVKRIFTSTATPLGRERYFEGHGLVDLVRAIQSV